MRIADKFAHLRMDIHVVGAARLRDGSGLLYIRRTEQKAWSRGYGGYMFDMLRLDPDTGVWTYTSVPKSVFTFIANAAVGATGRPGNRLVEVVDYRDLHPDLRAGGVLVVEPPPDGWLWEGSALSAEEQAAVAYNFGRSSVPVSA